MKKTRNISKTIICAVVLTALTVALAISVFAESKNFKFGSSGDEKTARCTLNGTLTGKDVTATLYANDSNAVVTIKMSGEYYDAATGATYGTGNGNGGFQQTETKISKGSNNNYVWVYAIATYTAKNTGGSNSDQLKLGWPKK